MLESICAGSCVLDGIKIAFVEDAKDAVASLVIVDDAGQRKATIPIGPGKTNSPAQMRLVVSLTWLTNTKFMITGSVSPDVEEVIAVDYVTGAVTVDTQMQSTGLFFSPNAEMYALEVGSPHYAPEQTYRPMLVVNDHIVFPAGGEHVKFLNEPQWSTDNSALAIVAEDVETKQTSLVLWRTSGSSQVTQIPLPSAGAIDLFWDQNRLNVAVDGRQLRLQPEGKLVAITEPQTVNPKQAALKFLNMTRSRDKGPEVLTPDYWCASCPLRILPRTNPLPEGSQ